MPVIGQYPLFQRRATTLTTGSPPADPPPVVGDDLSTWPFSGTFQTLALPGVPPIETYDDEGGLVYIPQDTAPYFVIFDITAVLPAGAIADVNSLRITGTNGVKLGHLRTASNRILVGGTFFAGLPITITYYWGKTAQAQPGSGFPTAAQMLSPCRLALLFVNGAAVDYSATPATWSTVGAPTFVAGKIGQAMRCGEGNYIQTTSAKLRSDARSQRHMMTLMYMPETDSQARTICWANWLTNDRALQLWAGTTHVELYIDDDGASPYQRWTNPSSQLSGWNWIGGSWVSGAATTITQRNQNAAITDVGFLEVPAQGDIFNSSSPYIIGGTPVAGAYHAGDIESVFEFFAALTVEQMQGWDLAWRTNELFLGIDRTPDDISAPQLTNQSQSVEIAFAVVQVTGISNGTAIGISGSGSPTFAISSSSSVVGDVRAKGSAPSTIDNGQWVRVWHTTAAAYSTTQISTLTVGTTSAARQSVTMAAPGTGGGGSNIPEGAASVVVNSLQQLETAFANASPGQIIEITAGDYKNSAGGISGYPGSIVFRNKDFSGQTPVVVRASTRPYRGYLAAQGGLMVSGESKWVSGSGGAEFNAINWNHIYNVVFDGLRGTRPASKDRWYAFSMNYCTDIILRFCKFSGAKPTTAESTWGPWQFPDNSPDNPWNQVGSGLALGNESPWEARTERIKIQNCFFHYFGSSIYLPKMWYSEITDCVSTDNKADHFRTDGENRDLIVRGNIFYRIFPQYNGIDIDHGDALQNATGNENGWRNHLIENNIVSVGDSIHGKMQGFFYGDKAVAGTIRGHLTTVRNCLLHSPTTNTVMIAPSDRTTIANITVISDMTAGRPAGSVPPDSAQLINTNWSGTSFGNNTVSRCVYHSLSVGAGDTSTQNLNLARSAYAANLVNYAESGSAGLYVLNPYTGVIDTTAIGRLAPKSASFIHPNQTGYHIGCSELFETLGVLP